VTQTHFMGRRPALWAWAGLWAKPPMVVSVAKLEANRRNATRSCGPRTEAGKSRSKLNAVKHGMRAATSVLLDEDAQALDYRKADWTARLGSVAIRSYTGVLKVCWTLVRASAAGAWCRFPGPSGDNSEVL
jgi:hypothetical protein